MGEWQPARCNPVHGIMRTKYEEVRRRHIRIRPTLREYYPEEREELGCDAQKFYEVHPDDCFEGCGDLLCEHEILTD